VSSIALSVPLPLMVSTDRADLQNIRYFYSSKKISNETRNLELPRLLMHQY